LVKLYLFSKSSDAMKAPDKLVELLRDSQWHRSDEIKEAVSLPEDTLNEIINFLEDEAFITLDEGKRKMKIKPLGLRFLELPTE